MGDDPVNRQAISSYQEEEYEFPYHHIPRFVDDDTGVRYRDLGWGLEYLCYLRHLSELIGSLAPQSVLDIGCGDGRLLCSISSLVPRRVGIDLSHRAISFARGFDPDGTYEVSGPEALDATFDVVTAIEVLEHVPDDAVPSFLRAIASRTRTGGHAILAVPTAATPVNRKHYRHYTLELFKRQLAESGASLHVSRVEYVYRSSKRIEWYRRLTSNRHWFVSIRWLRRWAWRHVWRTLRYASAEDGRHLVVTLEKDPPA